MNAWDVGQLVLWVVVLANALLTLALVRRVAALGREGGTGRAAPVGGLPPGSPAPRFTARTPDGEQVSSAPGTALLGFFSPTCDSCHDHLPHFAELARRAAADGVEAYAVVDGDRAAAGDLLARVPDGDLRVLLAPRPDNPLLGGYLVDAYPTYTAVVDGVVDGSFHGVADLHRWLAARTGAGSHTP